MQQPLLEIDNLSIAFRQQGATTTVVEQLSLSLNAGETLALVGESGSGKSVSALSILRLLPEPPVTSRCFTPAHRRCAAFAATASR